MERVSNRRTKLFDFENAVNPFRLRRNSAALGAIRVKFFWAFARANHTITYEIIRNRSHRPAPPHTHKSASFGHRRERNNDLPETTTAPVAVKQLSVLKIKIMSHYVTQWFCKRLFTAVERW
jgi:hypothetical protein